MTAERSSLLLHALVALAIFCVPALRAQVTAADSAGIREAARGYAQGWYEGDTDRLSHVLHPAFARRIVHEADGLSSLRDMDYEALLGAVRTGYGTRTPASERRADVTILDAYAHTAAVRLDLHGWVEYLHLARWNGAWKIVNALWMPRP